MTRKTTINILCILIICTLGISVTLPLIDMAGGFYSGFNSADLSTQTNHNKESDDIVYWGIEARINDFYEKCFADEALNRTNDTTTCRTVPSKVVVFIPDKQFSIGYIVGFALCMTVWVVLSILTIVALIKFIIKINKGFVFVEKNVKYLRRIAWCLLGISASQCVAGVLQEHLISGVNATIDGAALSAYWEMPWTTVILGLMALLIAEVWDRGIKMQEEQELTI